MKCGLQRSDWNCVAYTGGGGEGYNLTGINNFIFIIRHFGKVYVATAHASQSSVSE